MYFLQQPGLPEDALGRITLGPLECVETSMRIVLAYLGVSLIGKVFSMFSRRICKTSTKVKIYILLFEKIIKIIILLK